MSFLVDANVLSEATRAEPNAGVVAWLFEHEAELFVDPIILGELELGILRLPRSRRRLALEKWFHTSIARFACLPFTSETAGYWARLLADLQRRGVAMPIKDSLIAATAVANGLTVVTRNTRDFRHAGVSLLDPFSLH